MNDNFRWIASWFSPQQVCEEGNLPPPPGLAGRVLRQTVRPSLGGKAFRLRFSNLFGDSALVLDLAAVEILGEDGVPLPGSQRPLAFGGSAVLRLRAGEESVSDAVDMPIRGLERLRVSFRVLTCPAILTSHPGSRTTSYIDPDIPVEHWYFLTGLDALAKKPRAAVVAIGDSITDGRGTTTNGDKRWTDVLARRIAAAPGLRGTAVLNSGIGGNRLLADGLGPSGLSRVERDAIGPLGARWLILLEGVNDIGTRDPKESPEAFLEVLLGGYRGLISRARRGDLSVIGGTITPFGGSQYDTPENSGIRRKVNAWIAGSGEFDGVVDFDKAVRDPENPERLLSVYDSGDHLHLNDAGYRAMAEAVDLGLFALT